MNRPMVVPVVIRHAEDAAYYWSIIDRTADNTHIGADRSAHFASLLSANLGGLRANAPECLPIALDALDRWGKAGETFVAMYCCLIVQDRDLAEAAMARVLDKVRRAPDALLRGAISALGWVPRTAAMAWVHRALRSAEPVDQVLALRALACIGDEGTDVSALLAHPSAHVRAAACRAGAVDSLAVLQQLLVDPEAPVRAEAVIAWARRTRAEERSNELTAVLCRQLWTCIAGQVLVLSQATGWHQVPARRRLERWLRAMAGLLPVGQADVRTLVTQLPVRQALGFCAHHGDPDLLAFVRAMMLDPAHARWAGWVWEAMTGVSLEDNGLVQEETFVDVDAPLTQAQQDADLGLPLPHPERVARHPASQAAWPSGQRILKGREAQPDWLKSLLSPSKDEAQAVRFIAAEFLSALSPGDELQLRARPSTQATQLRALGLTPQ